MSSKRNAATAVTIFVGAFAVYQASLSFCGKVLPTWWVFGADNYHWAFVDLAEGHRMTLYMVKKHVLFWVIEAPLYDLGRLVYGAVDGPAGTNLARHFPGAVVGAANVCTAWLLLRRVAGHAGLAAPFLLLYAASGSVWMFSSFPESYVLTALTTNLFLLSLLRPGPVPVALPALTNALAGLAAPQQILLAVVPGLLYLREGARRAWRRIGVYALILVAAFGVPWLAANSITKDGLDPAAWRWGWFAFLRVLRNDPNLEARAHMGNAFLDVVTNHVLYATATPPLDPYPWQIPNDIQHPPWSAVFGAPLSYALVALALLALVLPGIGRALRQPPPTLPFARPLFLYLMIYLVFFTLVNPMDAYLPTAPFLLPWLSLASAGWSQAGAGTRVRAAAWVVAVACAATNAVFMLSLNQLAGP